MSKTMHGVTSLTLVSFLLNTLVPSLALATPTQPLPPTTTISKLVQAEVAKRNLAKELEETQDIILGLSDAELDSFLQNLSKETLALFGNADNAHKRALTDAFRSNANPSAVIGMSEQVKKEFDGIATQITHTVGGLPTAAKIAEQAKENRRGFFRLVRHLFTAALLTTILGVGSRSFGNVGTTLMYQFGFQNTANYNGYIHEMIRVSDPQNTWDRHVLTWSGERYLSPFGFERLIARYLVRDRYLIPADGIDEMRDNATWRFNNRIREAIESGKTGFYVSQQTGSSVAPGKKWTSEDGRWDWVALDEAGQIQVGQSAWYFASYGEPQYRADQLQNYGHQLYQVAQGLAFAAAVAGLAGAAYGAHKGRRLHRKKKELAQKTKRLEEFQAKFEEAVLAPLRKKRDDVPTNYNDAVAWLETEAQFMSKQGLSLVRALQEQVECPEIAADILTNPKAPNTRVNNDKEAQKDAEAQREHDSENEAGSSGHAASLKR